MALFSMFKRVTNQQYKYIPRYWDPEKEKRAETVRLLTGDESNDIGDMQARVARGLKRGRNGSSRSNQVLKTNLLLFAVIIALLGVTYFILVVYLPQIVASVEGVTN